MRVLVIALVLGLMTVVGCQQMQTEQATEENIVYEQNVDESLIDKRAGQSEALAVSLERANSGGLGPGATADWQFATSSASTTVCWPTSGSIEDGSVS